MSKIKKIVVAAMITTMAFSMAGCKLVAKTPEAIAKTVLAKVGGEKITLADVDNELKADIDTLKQQYGEDYESKIDDDLKTQLKTVREQVLSQLVEEKILLIKAKELGLEPTQEELDKEVETKTASLVELYGGEDKFAEAKTYYGYTDETFKTFLENQIRTERVSTEVTKDVTVTDEEVTKYYEDNKATFVNSGEAATRHLLFTTEEEAKAASDKIKSGETTFDNLFTEYADNKAKASATDATDADKALPISEDLGTVSHEEANFDPLFLAGLKTLKEGEVSEPVESSFGYHIIEAKSVKETTDKPFDDELKATIKTTIENTKKTEVYTSKLEEFKKELKVKTYEDRL